MSAGSAPRWAFFVSDILPEITHRWRAGAANLGCGWGTAALRRSQASTPATERLSLMKIHCLVDNSVAPLSDYWGEHGLSFLVETDEGRRLLFDTGAGGTVLMHNLERAGVGVDTIDAVVLSHSHPDHTGGLPDASEAAGRYSVVHAHPELLVLDTPKRTET